MSYEKGRQKYRVKVRADHDFDGEVRPLLFRHEEGPTVRVDRILEIRPAASTKAGGFGTRYTCRCGDKMVYLFREPESLGAGWYAEDIGDWPGA